MGYGISAVFDTVRELPFTAVSEVYTSVGSPLERKIEEWVKK